MHHIGYYILGGLALISAGGYLYAKYWAKAEAEAESVAKSAGSKLSKL